MATDEAPRSRRALLAGAAAGAAVLAAARFVGPDDARAADPDDLVLNQDNPITAPTGVTQGTTGEDAFVVSSPGGRGVVATSGAGAALTGSTNDTATAAVIGLSGDPAGSAYVDPSSQVLDSALYGYANSTDTSSGVWGESGDVGLVGVFGSGFYGVEGYGVAGAEFKGTAIGVIARSDAGTAVAAHFGPGTRPTRPSEGTALFASVDSVSQVGLEARGRVKFPHRSGRKYIAAGGTRVTFSVAGVTSGNFAIATLAQYRSGRQVAAVVCATGKITIYLNGKVSTKTAVNWLVLG